MFVSFEGVDWSGKSTQALLLADWLREQGRAVLATREPGGTPVAETVRELVLHGDEMAPWTEAALYAAARAEHVAQVIRPALERGEDVICDRYLDSSVAYQGWRPRTRRGSRARAQPHRHRRTAARPHLPRAARSRDRRAAPGGDHDRIERAGGDFMHAVDRAYRVLAAN